MPVLPTLRSLDRPELETPRPRPPIPRDILVGRLSKVARRHIADSAVVPWEEVNAAAAAAAKPESPPPTFATATATASLLTDKREVINDSSQGERLHLSTHFDH